MESAKDQFQQMREEELQESSNRGLAINEKSFLNLDKASVLDMAHMVIGKYTDGNNSPYEGLLLAKKLIDLGEEIKSNLSDNAANELRLAKSEKRIVGTTTVTEQMVGVRYDFSKCNSPVWQRLKDKLAAEEAVLKSIIGHKDILDEETGEVYRAIEPVKSGKMGLIIKY